MKTAVFLILGLSLTAVYGNKVFASDHSDELHFEVDSLFTSRKVISIPKTYFSKVIKNSNDSINAVDNIEKTDDDIISFSVTDVNGGVFDNIQCSMKYRYLHFSDWSEMQIRLLNCRNNEMHFQDDGILVSVAF